LYDNPSGRAPNILEGFSMTTETKQVSSVLNGLIETCKDGENGFRKAAADVKESSLQALFSKYSTQRASYAQELQQLVSGLGEKPATEEHLSAKLHRGWIGLKESVVGDKDKALIFEAEAGEDAAMKNYKEALEQALPPSVMAVVQKQFSGVQEAHGVIRDLKHSRQ
jgi:uncharacterized protein (TIGR02284 family)